MRDRQDISGNGIDRRQLNCGLIALSLLLIEGCSFLRSPDELEQAADELDQRLEGLQAPNQEELRMLARQLRQQAEQLKQTHDRFATTFNETASSWSDTDSELQALFAEYEVRRKQIRNDLLQTQYQLRVAVPDDTWPDIADLLNRKAGLVATRTGSGS